MEFIQKIFYSIKQGFKGIFTNKTMSFISIVSVTSVLAILGVVLSIVLNINSFMEETKDQVNEIRVSLKSDLQFGNVAYVEEQLKSIAGVEKLSYETKEQAFDSMKESFGDEQHLLDGVKNPLDDYYILTISDSAQTEKIVKKIKSINGINEVQYYQDIMKNFLKTSEAVKKFGGIIIGFSVMICLVLISNTIKSRVYSKKEEIQVIKYIGGSNKFVIAPFIVEGCIIGLFGSIVSIGICIGLYNYVLENMKLSFNSIVSDMMLPLSSISMVLVAILLSTGVLLGIVGSGLSVKKYLNV